MKTIKEILEEIQSVYEGLILTHPLDASMEYLTNWCNFENKIEYKKLESTKFVAIIRTSITMTELDVLLKNTNNLGYYPAYIYDKINNIGKKYTLDNVNDMINAKVIFEIRFEAKYGDVIDGESYKLLYHVTDIKYKDKILRCGLCPKSKEKLAAHPDRVYLTLKKETAYLFSYYPQSKITTPILFEVDLNKSQTEVTLYLDPNFKVTGDARGFYTNDNISPRCLKIVNNS